MIYYLLFFELQIKRYELPKFGLNSDSNFYLNSVLNRGSTHGGFILGHTDSGGSDLGAVGSYVNQTDLIRWYPFA
jgi:hypothetical protein